jgi:hypothetical protein
MNVVLSNRAEISLRSLNSKETGDVQRILHRLEMGSFDELVQSRRLIPLRPVKSRLYMIRVTHDLRMVLSYKESVLYVEDIAPRDRVDRLVQGPRQ